jgi:hypothetical protein
MGNMQPKMDGHASYFQEQTTAYSGQGSMEIWNQRNSQGNAQEWNDSQYMGFQVREWYVSDA